MTNRLSKETSPYLLQHQHNPVDWYPWGEEALTRAKKEDKPILLSIGYSACHWCHVMEHESFENPEIARLMNENFVSIKVDREERPDLDQIYQNVAQAMTRSGGWPLTVFLTPELKPYFGGTYFPPEDRYGRPGFERVVAALSEAYRKERQSVEENAEKLLEFIQKYEAASQPTGSGKILEKGDFDKITGQLLGYVDWENGGVGNAPKFPNTMIFTYLWRYGLASGAKAPCDATRFALNRMASGGIYDQLGGGFHRYSVDEKWSVPHFEKMLYDQALLIRLYSEVVANGEGKIEPFEKEHYLHVIQQSLQYLEREMTAQDGAFYASQDADSEGEEGKFFVWDLNELNQHLEPKEATAFALRYGISETGNFEHGKTVLFLQKEVSAVAQLIGTSEDEAQSLLRSAETKLLSVRSQRIAPGTDQKILTSWNALMIQGLVWACQALSRSGLTEDSQKARSAARKAFSTLVAKYSRSGGRLTSGSHGGNGFLDDYAFLAKAALELARTETDPVQRESDLNYCKTWIDSVLRHFKDHDGSGYFFTSDDHEKLIQRPKSIQDQAIPSSTAVVLECMSVLAEMDFNGARSSYSTEIETQSRAMSTIVLQSSYGVGELLCFELLAQLGPVVVTGQKAEGFCFHPHLFPKGPAPENAGISLVCHRNTCTLPLHSREAIEKEIAMRIRFP